MEKIKLVSGEEFSLIVCGIMADAQTSCFVNNCK